MKVIWSSTFDLLVNYSSQPRTAFKKAMLIKFWQPCYPGNLFCTSHRGKISPMSNFKKWPDFSFSLCWNLDIQSYMFQICAGTSVIIIIIKSIDIKGDASSVCEILSSVTVTCMWWWALSAKQFFLVKVCNSSSVLMDQYPGNLF